jgi:hypothetical protein
MVDATEVGTDLVTGFRFLVSVKRQTQNIQLEIAEQK